MDRSKNATLLNCEALEDRDVPAVVVQGTLAMAGTPPTPNGGNVTIQELEITATQTNISNQAFTSTGTGTPRSATASDNVTLTLNGDKLTINSSDGVYVRFTFGGSTFFHDRGTTLDITGVNGLNVDLQLGGNDNVTINGTATYNMTVNGGEGNDTILDNTGLTATLNGGNGNDTIKAMGSSTINPLLLMGAGGKGINPLLFAGMGGTKMIQGGDGDDNITGPFFGFFNTLDGGAGNDTIIGGFGPDIIIGGTGFDILFGFGGKDFYIDLDTAFILNQKGDFVFAPAAIVSVK